MTALRWVLGLFFLLEASNVGALYLVPGSRKANAVGVFSAWERSKQDPVVHDLVRYLVFWVAGTKLILLGLLAVILVTAPQRTVAIAGLVLAASIAAFYWRMFPLVRSMDRSGQVAPAGYSRTLGIMIATMVVAITGASVAALL